MSIMNPGNLYKEYLLNGSSNDMAVDGSGTPVVFSADIPTDKILHASRLILYIEGSTAFASEKFGNLPVLPNGVLIKAGGVTIETWKDNVDLNTSMFDTEGRSNFSKADRSMSARWSFFKESGYGLSLLPGESFSATIQDNLSTLVHFRMKLGGHMMNAKGGG